MSIDTYPPQSTQATVQVMETLNGNTRNTATGAPADPIVWADAVATAMLIDWSVPPQYAGGDVALNVMRLGGATGTAVMDYTIQRQRNNSAPANIVTSTSINFTPGDTLNHIVSLSLAASNITAGDSLRITVNRDGAHASDTMAATVYYQGVYVTYNAYVMGYAAYPASVNNASYEEGTFTVTGTGFSGTAPSGTAQYVRIGKQATVMFPTLTGTSNATTLTLTGLPPALQAVAAFGCYAQVVDNGAYQTQAGFVSVAAASSTITLYRDGTGTAWAAANNKGVGAFSMTYRTV